MANHRHSSVCRMLTALSGGGRFFSHTKDVVLSGGWGLALSLLLVKDARLAFCGEAMYLGKTVSS